MEETENLAVSDMAAGFPTSFWQIREMTMLYSCAMREVCTKLENLSQEFELNKDRNPIQHITHRLKKTYSIRNKMLQKNLPLEYETMRDEITDIGGIRVICSYIGLHCESKAQRIQELSPDCCHSHLPFIGKTNNSDRNSDEDHSHGFLGKPGASASL